MVINLIAGSERWHAYFISDKKIAEIVSITGVQLQIQTWYHPKTNHVY